MKPALSVVIPVLNEAANLEALHREFTQALTATGRPYELLLIDDGSTDDSFTILKRLQAGDRRMRVIRFRRNFGQTAAFAAGIDAARGSFVITADGDLQNDPKDIGAMLARLESDGVDIVCGWRKDRKDPFVSRQLPSMVANRLISWATGVRLHDYGCSLKVFRTEVIKAVRLRGEMHRFLPALASGVGAAIVEMPVNHRARTQGTSNYGIGRTFRVILDLLTVKFILSYSTQPLQIFGLLGGAMTLVGVGLLGYLGAMRLLHGFQAGFITQHLPLTLFGILMFFTGVQFITLGLLAELQARNYQELQNRPSYVVREVVESLGE